MIYLNTLLNMAGDMVLLFLATLLLVRIVGLRAFTKMSGFDFALTVATGSIIAGVVISPDLPVGRGVAALALLFAVQFTAAWSRRRWDGLERVMDNTPLLLMDGPDILEDNLRHARVTRADLHAKLREANVLDFSEVRAVVLEGTGDVSVLHGPADGMPLASDLLDGVRRAP